MFDHTSYDFGAVARGAKAEHRFTIQNIYEEDMSIVSVSSSCGCTQPSVTKKLLKKWEKAELVATLDTRSFWGQRGATVTVRFGPPFVGEVRVNVTCLIRGDVVVQPGVIQFGSVNQGAAVARTATISYAGRTDWAIQRIEASKYVKAEAREASRDLGGNVTYNLTVSLEPDAPAGYIKEQITLVTNDLNAKSARVPVPVEGLVVPGISAGPSPLLLGVVPKGQSTTKTIVVQGRAPFRVLKAQCADPRFQIEVPTGAKPYHTVPVTFTANGASGDINQFVTLETDAGAPLTVRVHVRVVEPAEIADPKELVAPSGEAGAGVNPPPLVPAPKPRTAKP